MKYLIIVVMIGISMPIAAQKESFDLASFTSPKGWTRIDSNGVMGFQDYRVKNDQTTFCQILLFKSRASKENAQKNFEDEWIHRVANRSQEVGIPKTETVKSPDGWTAVTGFANITQQGITYTCLLVTVSGFDRLMSVVINMAGQDYAADVQNFLGSFDLDREAAVKARNKPPQNTNSTAFNWSDYSFITPEKWFTQKTNEYIMLSQSQTEQGCVITILPPQPSSGNLETDARNIFKIMYPGWSYRFTGEKQYDLSRGFTSQGLEYYMLEAPMHKMRPDGFYYEYEDGSAWVIRLGNQVVIVSGRHNRLLSCYCHHHYENWRRFFNSFTVKNQAPSTNPQENASGRIVGSWMLMGGTVITEYIFAANGNYQFIGAYGTTSTTSRGANDYIITKSSAWKGDGTYSISGNQLTIRKYGGRDTEQVPFRFEKVNHGGTGWKDRLYMRKISLTDGKEFEVCYEKQTK